ncbi:hypothetical protein ACWCRC_37230 [Streptomyces sp. NPDC001940]
MSVIDTTRAIVRHRRMSWLEMAAYVAQLEGENTALIAENTTLETQLDQAAIDISGLGEDLRVARGENLRLDAALTATNARLANATSVGPLPQHVSTQPVPIVQRFESGPVLRAGASPLAAVTDPGMAGGIDKTQPIPAVTTT